MKTFLIGLAALAAPQLASAQTLQCTAPAGPQSIRPDLPSQSQPTRVLPIGSYTLAITWSPQYCRDAKGDSSFQCGSGNRFGFTLHGLWPDGVGKDWPQYCRPTAILPQAVVRRHICATPSAQLLQHEWSKHGTCMPGYSPARYFQRSNALYDRLRYPDMMALSRRDDLTAGDLATAFAAGNRGMTADMMRVTATRAGWLDEIWICLNKAFRPTRCPVHQGGLAPNAPLKIWRGGR
ncbi:ribonuclease T2 family protein [Sphingomonas sanguinis]|jgi:ribonuclease T2|uniref:Ribonuclease T n=1 Tax=Sphingomonas sanguinis TaxID=33051 RepID=A0A7Y7QT63_9SPHN|nr:ribonuclease T [Sphingomonas sanguinis]MBZ6380950.1 ribonuclease T [Sphingomonas sanguinis]NNG50973.1 ribonuclease T [Sphingomonas sanguinis]NNG55397.1 ribonuclease T [Sphingomonas sanguinis]NVP30251.1 ribonuclease T [Sphingomonas sanguinis]